MRKVSIFLSGFFAGAILLGSALAFAEYGDKNIAAKYADIKIVVEGALVKSSIEPFIYQDRTYVPLRAIAESLRKEVGWENYTVLIGSGKQSLLLTDLLLPSSTAVTCFSTTNNKVNGTAYPRGFSVLGKEGRPDGSVSFSIVDKGIKEINGSMAMDDMNPDNLQVDLKVLLDGKKIWQGTLRKGDTPVPISIKPEESSKSLEFQFSSPKVAKVDFIDFLAGY